MQVCSQPYEKHSHWIQPQRYHYFTAELKVDQHFSFCSTGDDACDVHFMDVRDENSLMSIAWDWQVLTSAQTKSYVVIKWFW